MRTSTWMILSCALALAACEQESDSGGSGGAGGEIGGAGGEISGGAGGEISGGAGGAGGEIGGAGGDIGGAGGEPGRQCDEIDCGMLPRQPMCPPNATAQPFVCALDARDACSWQGGECVAEGCAVDDCGPEPIFDACPEDTMRRPLVCRQTPQGVCEWRGGMCVSPESCEPEDCGDAPEVAPCPDGNGPRVSCEVQENGACGWEIGRCEPPVGDQCGGFGGETCGEAEWCEFDGGGCGFADGGGSCRPRPDACPDVEMPVCGCDGQDYSNRCEAHAAGVDVLASGPCGDPLPACTEEECGPAPGAPSYECDDGTVAGPYCDRDGAGVCGWQVRECPEPESVCTLPPEQGPCEAAFMKWYFDAERGVCDMFLWGGCGGNDNRFDSQEACEARCADEPTNPGMVACGARLGDTCAADYFCDFAGEMCDWADATGTCQPRPEICPDNIEPVCGCDGRTYDNLCNAQAAGVDAAYSGRCQM